MTDWLRRYVVFDDNDESSVVVSDGPGGAAATALEERDERRESIMPGIVCLMVFPESLRRCYDVAVDITYTAGASYDDGRGHYQVTSCRARHKDARDWKDAARDALKADEHTRQQHEIERLKRGLPPQPELKMQADPAGHELFLLAFYPWSDWQFFRLPIARVDSKTVWLLPRRFDPLQTQSLDVSYLTDGARYDQPTTSAPGTLWIGPDKDHLLGLAHAYWDGEACNARALADSLIKSHPGGKA